MWIKRTVKMIGQLEADLFFEVLLDESAKENTIVKFPVMTYDEQGNCFVITYQIKSED